MRPHISPQDAETSTQISRRDKWPRAWRLLFIVGCSLLLWALIYAVVRWI